MGLSTHHKISAAVAIIILLCTFGFRSIRAQEAGGVAVGDLQDAITIEEIKAEEIDVDLDQAESKDGQKSEIVKQIRKLNPDGSYTVGYEADDGTFKIESRDVLGNVKGTYGYVDVNGEIKRVSYITNNGTRLKADSAVEETTTTPRRNKGTPTTRRPYSSSTASPTRPSVIQTIPRRLRISSTASTYNDSAKPVKPADPTTTIVYATSVPTPKTYVNIRPTPLPGTNMRQAEQLVRPDRLEVNQGSKQQVPSSKDVPTTKPVTEEIEEKDSEPVPYHSNLLRRQLMPDAETQYDTQHQIVYNSQADDDIRNVYGTIGSTARPLFTTTSSPRIPPVILAARQRAAQIQNAINANNQPVTEKYYIKSSRRQETETEPSTEPTSENYLTQSPVPVQIPATRDGDKRVLRRQNLRPNPHFVRVIPQTQQQGSPSSPEYESARVVRIPLNQNSQQPDPHEQYLRETTVPPMRQEQSAEQEPIPVRIPQSVYRNQLSPIPTPQSSQFYVYPEQEPSQSYPNYPVPYPAPQPQFNDYLGRPPLTTNDFERLLQLLIYRHQYTQQRQGYPSGYGANPYLGYPNPYGPYPVYSTRPPPNFLQYRSPIPQYESDGMYQAQSPISSAEPPMSYELQRLMPRRKPYNPRYFAGQRSLYGADDGYAGVAPSASTAGSYLPPEVREELLYRMLMLALQSEQQQQQAQSIPVPVTQSVISMDAEASTTTRSPVIYKKPVRSVQIIGEEQQ